MTDTQKRPGRKPNPLRPLATNIFLFAHHRAHIETAAAAENITISAYLRLLVDRDMRRSNLRAQIAKASPAAKETFTALTGEQVQS